MNKSIAAPISIIIPIKDYHSFLYRSISSLEISRVKPAEIVVIDDGSSDSIASWYARQLKNVSPDSHIIQIRIESLGAGAARRIGIENASQPWVAFLDSDDQWPSDYLDKRLQLVGNGYEIICGPFMYINEMAKTGRPDAYRKAEISKWRLIINNPIANSCVICSREFLLAHGSYSTLYARSDYATWLRISWTGGARIFYDKEGPMVSITRRRNSLSSNKINMIIYNFCAFREAGFPRIICYLCTLANIVSFVCGRMTFLLRVKRGN